MPITREEKDRRVANGLCEQCGDEPVEGTTRKGARCKEANRKSRAGTKEKKLAAGVCVREGCSDPAKEGCRMCQTHIDESSAGTKRNYRKKKTAGTCPYCRAGTPVEPGHRACRKHLDSLKASGMKIYAECKRTGQCFFCSHPKKPALPGKAYCEEHRQQNILRGRRLHIQRRQKVFDYYGRKCRCCGLTVEQALQIDHVDGKGNEHRRQIGQGRLYVWLIQNNFPPGFQVLCALCNWLKKHSGACIHQTMPAAALELTLAYTAELDRILKAQP